MKLNYITNRTTSIPLTRLQAQGAFFRLQNQLVWRKDFARLFFWEPSMTFEQFRNANQIEIVEDPDDSDVRKVI